MDQKQCTTCGSVKPVEAFLKKNGQPGKVCLPCRDKAIAYQRAHRDRHHGGRDPHKARQHQHYEDFVEDRGEFCFICGSPPDTRRLHVDHCHKTERVRGLLCLNCNTGLGKFKDDPTLLQKAIDYLA